MTVYDPPSPAQTPDAGYPKTYWPQENMLHSGIAWHSPASVHYGTYEDIDDARQKTLNRVYHQHLQRFNKPPRTPKIRTEAWINEPAKETTMTTEKIKEEIIEETV